MKKYIILVFIIFFVSCQKNNEKTIESLKVWYYNGIFDRVMAVSCNEIIYLPEKVDTLDVLLEDGGYLPKEVVVLESIITDKEVLQKIATELKLAKKTKDCGIDARTKCYIKFTNGSIDSLCLAEHLTYGYYNNKSKAFTNKFVYLIRKNSGFYWWIGIDYMKYFDELNDTTFVREKIKSRWGGEY
jgi:hypothetical protein